MSLISRIGGVHLRKSAVKQLKRESSILADTSRMEIKAKPARTVER